MGRWSNLQPYTLMDDGPAVDWLYFRDVIKTTNNFQMGNSSASWYKRELYLLIALCGSVLKWSYRSEIWQAPHWYQDAYRGAWKDNTYLKASPFCEILGYHVVSFIVNKGPGYMDIQLFIAQIAMWYPCRIALLFNDKNTHVFHVSRHTPVRLYFYSTQQHSIMPIMTSE